MLTRGIEIIFFAVFIVIVIAFLTARKLTTRINDLVEIFTEVTKGNRKNRAKIVSNDEIGLLAQGFNMMLDELLATEKVIYTQHTAWSYGNINKVLHKKGNLIWQRL